MSKDIFGAIKEFEMSNEKLGFFKYNFLIRAIWFQFNSANMVPGDTKQVCMWTITPWQKYDKYHFTFDSNLTPQEDSIGVTSFSENRLIINQTKMFGTNTNINYLSI